MFGGSLFGQGTRSIQDRGQLILLGSLVLLTLGAWGATIYQARTMEMPMGIAVRGMADGDAPRVGEDTTAAMPGMAMSEPETDTVETLAGASMSGMSGMGWTWEAFLAFIMAWAVMMAAMMFPSVAPMLFLFHAMATRREAAGTAFVPTWVFALGYLGVWTAIGGVTWALIQVASDLASRLSVAERETWAPIALGTVLILAGIYQFTPLKRVCLRQCQSPLGFVMTHWRDGHRGALHMGVIHGAYCLGCCWALFGVLVATGVMSLAWMLLLTLVVAAEKLLPPGPRLPKVIGTGFLLAGVLVATGTTALPAVG